VAYHTPGHGRRHREAAMDSWALGFAR